MVEGAPEHGGSAVALSPAAVGGRRRKSSRKVSAKTIRKTLKRLGLKPKGRVVLKGGEEMGAPAADVPAAEATEGGRRRRRSARRTRRKTGLRRLFGL
jgi:hypothetical protein